MEFESVDEICDDGSSCGLLLCCSCWCRVAHLSCVRRGLQRRSGHFLTDLRLTMDGSSDINALALPVMNQRASSGAGSKDWITLGQLAPPPGSTVLVTDPERHEAVLLLKRESIEVWRWNGHNFAPAMGDFFGGVEASWPCGWYDPRRREIIVAAAVEDGLLTAPLEQPQTRTFLPFGKLASAWFGSVVAFDPASGDVFALCGDEREQLCVWRGRQVLSLGEAPVASIVYDQAHERLVGQALTDTFVREQDRWRKVSKDEVWSPSQFAWDPRRRLLLRLAADASQRGQMRLQYLGKDRWHNTEPARRLATMRHYGSLGCLGNDTLLLHGGSNHQTAPSSASNDTFVAASEQDFERVDLSAQLRLGRKCSLHNAVGAPLTVVDHSTLRVHTLTERGWGGSALSLSAPALHGPHDDRHTTFAIASGGVIYEIDGKGRLWRAQPGGRLERLTGTKDSPGPRCTGYHALAHDAPRQRLVLFGGETRNDTWIFDEARSTWSELLTTPRPPHGPGALCSTPEGIFLFVQHELWWLDDQQWRCVGHDPEWRSTVLFCDPARRTLWSAADGKVVTWQQGKFRQVAALPSGVKISSFPYDQAHLLGFDPSGDRLVAWAPTGVRVLPLASLGEAAHGELPTHPIEPPTQRLIEPPPEMLRTAARFKPIKGAAPAQKIPVARVPSGYRLLAVVPRHEQILPLPEGVTGLAVMVPEYGDHTGEDTRVELLRGEPFEGAWLRDDASDSLYPCQLLPFQEIDPDHEHLYDTLPGHQFDHAFNTRVGGFGRFIQENPAPRCRRCKTPMRFAMQLGSEVLMVGDMGENYVFFCLRGCGACVDLQMH